MDSRRWSRSAFAAALLFASVPLAARILLGYWDFGGAAELACASLLIAVYFHFRSRRHATMPDPATLLEHAGRLAAEGRIDRAIAVLTKAIRTSPRLWQAYQYRGELRLLKGNQTELALDDFSEAIRLAPDEPHLYVLRDRARSLT